MAKKNMGTVRDLIEVAPEGSSIEDGTRSYTKEEALRKLKPEILRALVHCVKDGCVYIEQVITLGDGARTRPIVVMAVRIVKGGAP